MSVWINEIHYDNTGVDVGEMIEIAGTAGTDLNSWFLVLYNGADGTSYQTINLNGFIIPDQGNGFGTLTFNAPGIQNGSPDGIALYDANSFSTVQFLSYEGSFTATNGLANGVTSTDIGVSELGFDPAGFSLQLTGTGSQYSDFTWAPDAASTFGSVNTGQTIDVAPVITSNGGGATASVSINENTQAITTVVATDTTAVTYSLAGGADMAKFAINGTTGALSFIAPPNFESPTDVGANNVYDVIVQASDGLLTDTQAIAVSILNVAPVITSNGGGATASVSINENTQAVTTVIATDTPLTYSLGGGADAAKFTIDSTTGALSFLAAPNFGNPTDVGTNNVYDVIVQASDGLLTDTQAIAVSILNVAPVITSNGGGATASVSINENTQAVTTVIATDTPLTYSLGGGADAAKFSINAATGALSFLAAPNFESPTDVGGNNVYDVIVQASDGLLTDTQAIAVSIVNATPEVVLGTAAADILNGSSDVDLIFGFSGDDTMSGMGNNDVLTGGAGRDTMTGGLGADTFDFDFKTETGKSAATRDLITDFTHGVDHIDLSTIDAVKGKGNQAFHFIKAAAFHHKAGELHIKFEGPHKTVVEGDLNGDGRADFQIELSGHLTITKGDFIL